MSNVIPFPRKPPQIHVKEGFDWAKVKWDTTGRYADGPCSYCGAEIPEGNVPLQLFGDAGMKMATFCDQCGETWFGIEKMPPEPFGMDLDYVELPLDSKD